MTPHGLMQNLDEIRSRLRVKLNADPRNAALKSLADQLFSNRPSMMDSSQSYAAVNMARLCNTFHSTLQAEMLRVSEAERDLEIRAKGLNLADPSHEQGIAEICKKHQALHENRRQLLKDHEGLMERRVTLLKREQQAIDLERNMTALRTSVQAARAAHQAASPEAKAQFKEIEGAFTLSTTLETDDILSSIAQDPQLGYIHQTEGMNAAIAALVQQKNEAAAKTNAGALSMSTAPRFKSTHALSQNQYRLMAMTGSHTVKAGTVIERYEQRGAAIEHVMCILGAQSFGDKLNPQQAIDAQRDILENLFKIALQFETNILQSGGKPQLSFNAHAIKDPKKRHAMTQNLKWLALILSFKYPNLKINVLGCDVSLPTKSNREEFISGLQRLDMEDEVAALQARDPSFRKNLETTSADESAPLTQELRL